MLTSSSAIPVTNTGCSPRFDEVTEEQVATAVEVFAPGPYPAAEPTQLYEWILSDWLFRMPSLHLAERAAEQASVHFYELTWSGVVERLPRLGPRP